MKQTCVRTRPYSNEYAPRHRTITDVRAQGTLQCCCCCCAISPQSLAHCCCCRRRRRDCYPAAVAFVVVTSIKQSGCAHEPQQHKHCTERLDDNNDDIAAMPVLGTFTQRLCAFHNHTTTNTHTHDAPKRGRKKHVSAQTDAVKEEKKTTPLHSSLHIVPEKWWQPLPTTQCVVSCVFN